MEDVYKNISQIQKDMNNVQITQDIQKQYSGYTEKQVQVNQNYFMISLKK